LGTNPITMKKLLFIPLFITSFLYGQDVSEIERCMSHKAIEYQDEITPGYASHVNEQFELAKHAPLTKTEKSTLLTIPVVVHVVHNTQDQNLEDSVILRQIETLNEDFQRQNPDTSNMRSDFDIVKGSPNIEFRLAQIDPQGDPTTGITRTETSQETFGDIGLISGDFSELEKVKQTTEGGHDPWDQSRYLNIWVCNMEVFNTTALLGYATPPDSLSNWPPNSNPNLIDGVVIQYQAFGSNNPNVLDAGQGPVTVMGRTTTHEVGHYLGLRHIWGDGDCNEQDGIDDTPNAEDQSQQDCDDTKNTCVDTIQGLDLPDMIENYMDYSAETCQNSFTQGQVDLMRGVLDNQRYDLVHDNPASVKAETANKVMIYPNPAHGKITVKLENGTAEMVEILGSSGRKVLSQRSSSQETSLDVSALDNGVYFIRIQQSTGEAAISKFVKR